MKSIIYSFDSVIYPYPLLVTKKFESKELADTFYVVNNDDGLEDKPEDFNPGPRTIARTIEVASKQTNQGYVIILLCRPRAIGNGTIAHEAYHFANMVASACGFFPESPNEDEPTAYLLQWAANCIASVKEDKPDSMKGVIFEDK